MARPSNTPRLNRIDPEKLAEEAEQRVLEYLSSFVMRLSPSAKFEVDSAINLRFAVGALASYAQRGEGLDAPVTEYLQTIAEAFWIRPIDGAGYETPEFDRAYHGDLDELDDDLPGRLSLVMVAATGREALAAKRPVSVAQLAALASQSPDHVRLRAREGQLRLTERSGTLTASAAEARKYLEAVAPNA